MRQAFGGWLLHRAMPALFIGSVLLVAAMSAGGAGIEYLLEDARITGDQINTFADKDQTIAVVLGGFSLTVGDRQITGRDAVVWVRDMQMGQSLRHEITIYVEGEAKVSEPGGSTNDRVMLVKVYQDGRLRLAGNITSQPLQDFPLYNRGVEARQSAWASQEPEPSHAAPPLIISRAPPPPAASQIAGAPSSAPAAGGVAVPGVPTAGAPKALAPPKPKPVEPVTFYAENFSSRQLSDTRRVTLARGNVYLSQGNPSSDLFLEIRAQSAAAFSEQGLPAKTRTGPLSSQLGAMRVPASGPAAAPESITGVYLEGDVIIARGERYMRAESAYYDFTNDRAIVINPVFRTVQERRSIPIYVRAEEARVLSAREIWFRDARVSSSDFHNPSYYIGSQQMYLRDTAPYDSEGVRLGPQSWESTTINNTFVAGGVPLLYWPYEQGSFEEGHTALRSAQFGRSGRFGWGVETEWQLFRLLGLRAPQGMSGRLSLDYYERGLLAGINIKYANATDQRSYSGYTKVYGMVDNRQEDNFGQTRDNIPAPQDRGRALVRHKELLPNNLEVQFELSYLCDRNFLEEFFRDEFYAGKEQETLLYAKKQADTWALTALIEYRLNRFNMGGVQPGSESWPDLGFRVTGQPVGDRLTFFSDSRAGIKRWHGDETLPPDTYSDMFARLDTRDELDAPVHLGPVNAVPYAVGRATYWGETPDGGDKARPYGQVGVKANTHLWRIYNDASSRLLDVNRLKHVITPEISAFGSADGGAEPNELFPLDPGVEQYVSEVHGVSVGLLQRLQTKRGVGENEHTVDWMRLNVTASFFDNKDAPTPYDGRWFWYRPEYSTADDNITADYAWSISDATSFLADATYDLERGEFFRADAGLAVSRDPRVRYYVGIRWIRPLSSSVGTGGLTYKINNKYSLSVFEQYDFRYDSGRNLATSVTLTRKFARWYGALTFVFDETQNGVGAFVSIWPEGIPEFMIGSGRTGVVGRSSEN